jgi:choline dehydrogenase-like flavoprotein
MPPNPIGYAAQLLAEGARRTGMETFPYPSAVNSQTFDGRPACTSCGLCSGFGCPVNARGDALVSYLNPAVRTGRVRVISRAWVHRIDTSPDGRRATAVRYRDEHGAEHAVSGEVVVIAASPINTARLLLLSANGAHPQGLGNRSDQVGRNMMFHNFTLGAAIYGTDVQPLRAQSTTLEIDDLVGPFTGPQVQALGVPYIKGGTIQVGSGVPLLQSALLFAGFTGFGRSHKQIMKLGPLHARVAGSQLVHEDLPQAANRIDLDPDVRDLHGVPVARITYSPHRHEQAAAELLGPRMEAYHAAAPGATGAVVLPYPLLEDGPIYTAHLAGTARMGEDPETSVCDATGRMHELDNVYLTDGSTFPTFPGFNPTLTIMANSLRIARGIAGGTAAAPVAQQPAAVPAPPPPVSPGGPPLPATGPPAGTRLLPVVLAGAGAAAAGLAHRGRTDATGDTR